MKAIVATRRGGPEVLELRDVPEPLADAARNEVLLRVEAIGVNFADTVQTQGMYPGGPRAPYVPGLEFAGRIDLDPEKNLYMGFAPMGAYAERIAVNRHALLRVPEGWSAVEAAAFPVNYFTAYFGYWMAGMTEVSAAQKKRVLIHAVAGGVGTAAVEMGKLLGVETYGTSSSDEKLAKVKALGLDHAINYKDSDYEAAIAELTHGTGVDACFEMLGGEHTAKSTRCLGDMGRLIIYGTATGQSPQFDFLSMFRKNISVHALWLTPLTANVQLMRQAWRDMSEWIAAGKLRPVVGHELPLAKAADAHHLLLKRENYGKVVLKV